MQRSRPLGLSSLPLATRFCHRSPWRTGCSSNDGSVRERADYDHPMPIFICPNCKERSIDDDGLQGLTHQPVACQSCGFGFLFQLLDDYYPSPLTGLIATNRNRRVLAVGRGVFELTGYTERDLMGKDVVGALKIGGCEEGNSPFELALEWGVRRLDQPLELESRVGIVKPVTVDVFPAYDSDGGLLVALTPRLG
jgi:hypothetical protein